MFHYEWPVPLERAISTRPEGTGKNLERGIQYGGGKGGSRIEERGRTLSKARDLVFTGPHAYAGLERIQGAGAEY